MPQPNLIAQELADHAVEHNGLIIPGRSIARVLSAHCICLGIYSRDDDYPIYLRGSATLLKYRGGAYLVCTRHQLQGVDLKDVCIMLPGDGRTTCITSGGATWWSHDLNEGEHNDLAVFDFTEPCTHVPELSPLFLNFRGEHPSVPVDQIAGLIAFGFPTEQTDYGSDGKHVGLKKRHVICRYACGSSDEAIHVVDPVKPIEFDPDGMSGGPAFLILNEAVGFTAHLAGIIGRGGRERLRLIKAGAVQMILENQSNSRGKI